MEVHVGSGSSLLEALADAGGVSSTFSAQDAVFSTLTLVKAAIRAGHLDTDDVPAAIKSFHEAIVGIAGLDKAEPIAEVPVSKPSTAAIEASISAEALTSFEDGKPYKSLKRHLTSRGLTPDGYRAKWGLPSNYPMVCSGYAAKRSELAKDIGLGTARTRKAA